MRVFVVPCRRLLLGFVISVGVIASLSCSPLHPAAVSAALYNRDVSQGINDVVPMRGTPGPLAFHLDGDDFPCSTCHEGFEGGLGQQALEDQHSNITFQHGLNVECLNCHNPKNADAYVYHDGSEIPGDEPTRLCAKCHGPHYREWNMNVHGRVMGSWGPEQGPQQRLDCIQCHDPHHPRFPEMAPESPPVLTRFEKAPSHPVTAPESVDTETVETEATEETPHDAS